MKQERPNIVVIMTDQQRADARALEGYPLDTTPFLDSLAARGVWFDKAYTTMPVCSPARTSMLTGRWPSSHRVSGNTVIDSVVYEQDLFDIAKTQGYRVALSGKNHSYVQAGQVDWVSKLGHWGGSDPGRTEDEQAYDEWLKTLSQVSLQATPFPLECQLPYRAVTAAQEWIGQEPDAPFLLWLSFPEPHNPYQAPEPYYSMFPPEQLPPLHAKEEERNAKGDKWRFYGQQIEHYLPDYRERIPRVRSNYLGMLRLIDDQLRRFVEFLEEERLMDNTLIVFVSDHGDFVGEYELIKKGPELPELLTRVPLQFMGPGISGEGKPHSAHVSIADIMPTLCQAMGSSIPAGVQGRSLWPLLTGQPYPKQEFASVFMEHGYGGLYHLDGSDPNYDLVGHIVDGVAEFNELNQYSQSGWMRAVRKGDWKLSMDMYGRGELYRVTEDPLELCNYYGDAAYRETERDMLAELCMWMIRCQSPTLPEGDRFPLKQDECNYLFP